MKEMEITVSCYETIDKVVKVQGNSGALYVPKAWEGKKVRVLLLEPLTESEE